MSKILVTGSEGSLMQAVIPLLLVAGHEIVGVDNLKRWGIRDAKNLYEFHELDLCDPYSTADLIDAVKPDYIIQAAALIYGVGGFNKYGADIIGSDITLHNNVLKGAVRNNVKRVIYISSSMVYENVPHYTGSIGVTEEDIDQYPAPKTYYGLSKYTNEKLCQAFNKQYGLEYTIWRPFNIITPFERTDGNDIGVSHVFADYIHNIIEEKKNPLPILGDGNQVRCFTWVYDVAEAIAYNSFKPEAKNEAFNIGNPEPITMKELAQLIYLYSYLSDKSKDLTFESLDAYVNDVRVRIPSVEKIYKTFGWEAKKKVRDSIKECVEFHYRSVKW